MRRTSVLLPAAAACCWGAGDIPPPCLRAASNVCFDVHSAAVPRRLQLLLTPRMLLMVLVLQLTRRMLMLVLVLMMVMVLMLLLVGLKRVARVPRVHRLSIP